MEFKLILNMAFQIIGGLGIFILGMNNLSNGLQTIAGERLRWLIEKVTNNRIFGAMIGTFVTVIIQSSSITTVMVVGFVNSGLMTLKQAIGIIMGANIGTTITGWILVIKIGKYGLPILGIFALVSIFAKKEKIRYLAVAIMGIGMVFFGLELMKNGFKPIKSIPEFVQAFHLFDAHSVFGVIKCILTGAIITTIVQSSSATLGITIGLASTGVISYETAVALVLGENIGTTITAFLASLATTQTNAKRAAYAHIVFNVIGVCYIFLLFPVYIAVVKMLVGNDPNAMIIKNGVETYPYITRGIATAHTTFNIMNTLIFLPFAHLLAQLLVKIVPERKKQKLPKFTHIDFGIIESPNLALEQTRSVIKDMVKMNQNMMDSFKVVLSEEKGPDSNYVKKIFEKEEILDVIQNEVAEFLTEVLSKNIPLSDTLQARYQIRIADELESFSDYMANITKKYLKIKNSPEKLKKLFINDLLILHDEILVNLNTVMNSFWQPQKADIIVEAKSQGDQITQLFKNLRTRMLEKIEKDKILPETIISYLDILNSYRKMKEHTLNIAELISGEK